MFQNLTQERGASDVRPGTPGVLNITAGKYCETPFDFQIRFETRNNLRPPSVKMLILMSFSEF